MHRCARRRPSSSGLPSQAAPARTAERKAECQRTLPTYPILRPGDRGQSVKTLQCSLNDLGLGPVVVDGFYGPQTKAAVKEIVDGFEGQPAAPVPDQQRLLGAAASAASCRTATSARCARAGGEGAAAGPAGGGRDLVVDGTFGPQTERAVKRYQMAHGVRQTGVVNERTRFFLGMGGVIGQLS